MRAAILGGAMSLPSDLPFIPPDTTLFSVNGHASRLVNCDYIVFNDPHTKDHLIKEATGEHLSQWPELSTIDLSHLFKVGNSAMFAVLAADFLNYKEIYIFGVDCYQGERMYFHQPKDEKNFRDAPNLANYLKRWKECFQQLPDDVQIRTPFWPLQECFNIQKLERGL